MNYSYYRMSLDVHDPTSQLSFSCQKDDTSRCLMVTLTDHGKPYQINKGCYAIFSARKPDGTVLYNDCTISNDTIFYYFTAQTASAVGSLYCDITLYNAYGEEMTSPNFTLVVYETAYSVAQTASKSTDEFKALTGIIQRGEAVLAMLEDFKGDKLTLLLERLDRMEELIGVGTIIEYDEVTESLILSSVEYDEETDSLIVAAIEYDEATESIKII